MEPWRERMFRLHVPSRPTRREAAGHLLAVHEERSWTGDAPNDVDVIDRSAIDGAVRIIKGHGPLGVARERIHIERNMIVELAKAGAEDRPFARKRSDDNTRAR